MMVKIVFLMCNNVIIYVCTYNFNVYVYLNGKEYTIIYKKCLLFLKP